MSELNEETNNLGRRTLKDSPAIAKSTWRIAFDTQSHPNYADDGPSGTFIKDISHMQIKTAKSVGVR